jgi:hypothetical protein
MASDLRVLHNLLVSEISRDQFHTLTALFWAKETYGTPWIRGLVVPGASLDNMGKSKFPSYFRKLNPDCRVTPSVSTVTKI